MSTPDSHESRIQRQFSQQAGTFGGVPSHSAAASLASLLRVAGARASDRALDLACGPGIVTLAFAPHVASICGVDVVPAMIEKARARQAELGVSNVTWAVGDASSLPYADAEFDLVVTRFSFHHLVEPLAILREMRRVCRPSGTLVVADVAPSPETSRAYDRFETIRDPSHTHALTEPELESLFAQARLPITRRERHGLPMALETQLAASFPAPGGADALRRLFADDVGVNALGVDARLENGALHFTYPVLVLASTKPSS